MSKTSTLVKVTERGTLPAVGTKMRIRVIAPGWGSSGYYSTEALAGAATAKVFHAGVPVYLDHPGAEERVDRPERSVRDLAGKLISDAIYEAAGPVGPGLYADIEVYPHVAPVIEAMADDIGMSIRATADAERGEAEGRTGLLVTRFDEALSVDFVTAAGAGGKVVQLLESARLAAEATTNDQRDALDQVLKDAYGAERTYVWLLDFDDTTCWFTVETAGDMATWSQAYATGDDGLASSLSGDRIEVRRVTQYVPVNPAGRTTQESKEDTMATVEEARLRQLEEDAGRVPTLVSERDKAVNERDDAQAALAEAKAEIAAAKTGVTVEKIIGEADAEFSELERAGLRALAPITDGVLDEAAFTKTVAEHAAKVAEAAGAGRVRGNGARQSTDTEVTEADLAALDAELFGAIKEA